GDHQWPDLGDRRGDTRYATGRLSSTRQDFITKSLLSRFLRVSWLFSSSTKLLITLRAFSEPQCSVSVDRSRSDLLSSVPPEFARTKISRAGDLSSSARCGSAWFAGATLCFYYERGSEIELFRAALARSRLPACCGSG